MARKRTWFSSRRLRSDRLKCQSHNAAHSNLYDLPAELLQMISQLLTLEDSIALTLTCSRFYNSTTLASIREGIETGSTTRFMAWCMLEDDGDLGGEYSCWGCLGKHPSIAFSKDELEKKQQTDRYCLMTKQSLRVGDTVFSFADVKRIANYSSTSTSTPPLIPKNWFSKLRSSPQTTITTTIRLHPEIMDMARHSEPSCRKAYLQLCPHMDLGERNVLARLYPKTLIQRYGVQRYKRTRICRQCGTQVTLVIPRLSGRLCTRDIWWFILEIERPVGRLFSPLESAWLTQSVVDTDFPTLQDYHNMRNGLVTAFFALPGEPTMSDLEEVCKFDFSTLPGPVILPSTSESLKAWFRVRRWLSLSKRVSEERHRRHGHQHKLAISGPVCFCSRCGVVDAYR